RSRQRYTRARRQRGVTQSRVSRRCDSAADGAAGNVAAARDSFGRAYKRASGRTRRRHSPTARRRMTTLFVTAAGTDVGKTFVTLKLMAELEAAGYRVRALKPVASGFDAAAVAESDTGQLLRAQRRPLEDANIAAVTPWRFAAP